jgi:hypothetical protein
MTDLFGELAAFGRLCETLGSEIDLTDSEAVLALMEETNIKPAAEALIDDVDEAEALLKGLQAKIDEFTARKTLHENTIKAAKQWLFKIVEQLPPKKGKRTLRLPTATVSYTAGASKVVITDESALPFDMLSTTDPTPDRKAIRAELDAGRAVPGAVLSNGEPTISIRRK